MNHSLLTVLALCSSFLAIPAANAGDWMTDYAAAKKKAAEAKKDLLLEFTGSDWCPPCMELTKNVFSKKAFTTGAEKDFILVILDFPRDESKIAEGLKKQNEQLAGQYAIESFPSVVLADAMGRPYAQTGFMEGGPDAYLQHLADLRKIRTERDHSIAAAQKLTGVEKAKALQNALAEFPDTIVEAFYADLAAEAEAADPEDETGFKKARAYRRDVAAYEQRVTDLFEQGKFADVIKEADQFTSTHQPTGLDKQHVMMARVMAHTELGDKTAALQSLAAMKAVAPESDLGVQADGFRERIEAFFAESKPAQQ